MTRRDKLGRIRTAEQDATTFKPSRAGAISRSHNINMSEVAHAAFSRLTAQERGDLIVRAIAGNKRRGK